MRCGSVTFSLHSSGYPLFESLPFNVSLDSSHTELHDPNKEVAMTYPSMTQVLGFIILGLAIGCDSGESGYGSKKSGKAADAPLVTPASSAARMENDEGVGHFQQGHWDVAMEHYQKAVKADPNSAVVHYNMALTLDKMGKHEDATASFKKALDLAPNDPAIKDSEILKKHVNM
jgi:tetratricopeptide (TPR) repeat protein